MVIIPCSMKTVAGIASGYSDNLLLRAADVTLKEQRPLVLVARETPMNAIHLRNLAQLASVPGITLMPPMMTYYHNPQTIDDMEDQLIGKIFDQFGLEYPPFERLGLRVCRFFFSLFPSKELVKQDIFGCPVSFCGVYF